jgi:hypothetical protein
MRLETDLQALCDLILNDDYNIYTNNKQTKRELWKEELKNVLN